MKTLRRPAIVVLACVVGVVWMLFVPWPPHADVLYKAAVLSALAGVAAIMVMVVEPWLRGSRRGADPPSAAQVQDAVAYLANETLRYWRTQANQRRITTPSPASVRWSWASTEVAVPPQDLQPDLPVVSGGLVLGESPARLLTAGVVTELREQLYERLDETRRRIVVLGGPGAGKTAAMLLLLIDSLEHRPPDTDQPVPVWLSLGGWNPKTTSLRDWAAATLTRDYPGLSAPAHGGQGAAAELIRTGRVALFLDGLDEMPPDLQGEALASIDRDAVGFKVVLTSRPDEYEAALTGGRLYGAAVIDVLPVGVEDATAFLLAEQLGQRRRDWQQVTGHLRDHPDSVAARTLTTPLALSLARDTYTEPGSNPADLLDTDKHPDPGALQRHLLARSLTLAYPDEAEYARARRWLSWIAQHMGNNRDLRWWDIPTWTPRWQLRLAAGLAGGRSREPRALAVRWPTRTELHRRRLRLVGGFAVGPVFGFAFWFVFGPAGSGNGLTYELAVGLVFGLVFGLAELWGTPLATAHAVGPLDVYRSDQRRTLVVGFAFGFAAGLAFGLALGPAYGYLGFAAGLTDGLAVGLVFGLVGGLVGLGPAFQLPVVQMIWLLRGQRVRFVSLLHTALQRQVLRQAGAVYQFRHAALQDYLRDL